MAESQETQQEKEARWAAYRASNERHQQNWRAARARKRRKASVITGGILILLAVIGGIMLL
jgi:hypothetical protein